MSISGDTMSFSAESEITDRPREGMDGEHTAQLQLLDQLVASLAENREDAALGEILDQFISYSDAHFMSEALLMRLYTYPQYEHHNAEHDALMQDAESLRALFSSRDQAPLRKAVEAFRARLAAHIAGKDEALGRYLAQHNAK